VLHERHLDLDRVFALVRPGVPHDVRVVLHQGGEDRLVDGRGAERRPKPGAPIRGDAIEHRVGVVGAENHDRVVRLAGRLLERVGDLAENT
jgi:hypothetical protein